MNITFCGANKEVTGSNTLIEVAGKKFLVDCGLIQGKDSDAERNADPFLYDPIEIDFVLLTHAHIDHSGRLPKLYKEGFNGKIYATKASIELCSIMLPDSGYIQVSETEWKNRKRKREGKQLLEPIYTQKEAVEVIDLFEKVDYNDIVEIDENIRVRFNDAGHMLGSSTIEIWVTENGKTTKIVFSGDLGNNNIKLLQPATPIMSADYVVMESTYGDRLHIQNSEDSAEKFLNVVSETLKRGGNVIIPSFAVGRTQELLYELNAIKDENKSEEFNRKYEDLMKAKVFVDSPLAISATEIFKNNMELFKDEAQERIQRGDNPLEFDGLNYSKTVEESMALNDAREPIIIISASGMCDAGRIKHHLKHNLWDPMNTVLFVGYQAPHTLGRRIIDGAKIVKIFGEEIKVNAQIESIDGMSGHADQEWLMNFIYSFREKPKKVFLVHGEERAQEVLKEKIEENIEVSTIIPNFGDKFRVDEIVRLKENVSKDTAEEVRKSRLDFIQKLTEVNDDVSILFSKLQDNVVHLEKKESKLTTEAEKKILQNLLDKLGEFEKTAKEAIENDTKDSNDKNTKKNSSISDEKTSKSKRKK